MKKLLSYEEIKQKYPLGNEQDNWIKTKRLEVSRILNNEDPRLLLIVGPCSIHDIASAKEFAFHLKKLAEEMGDQFLIIMRAYCEKSRTSLGWKGFIQDPDLNNSCNIQKGIEQTRQLLLELTELQIPLASEFVEPLLAPYYHDLITWGTIGARTCVSQSHRQLASSLSFPIGFKNSLSGDISAAVHGSISAMHTQNYISLDKDSHLCATKTLGNLDAHIVLRGGNLGPNYDKQNIRKALDLLKKSQQPLRLLVDCSHHNSNKVHSAQPAVFSSIIDQYLQGNTAIKGIMLESHLSSGKQLFENNPSQLTYGLSITDACLDWISTKELILQSADRLRQFKHASHLDKNAIGEFNLSRSVQS